MLPPILSALFSKPAESQKSNPKTLERTNQGQLMLQLLNDHSPALIEALETKNAAALGPLLWASSKRESHAGSRRLDANCHNPDGERLILRAAKAGDYPKATQALIRAGADLNSKDSEGRDVVILNTIKGRYRTLQALVDHATNNANNNHNDPIEDIRFLYDNDSEPAFSLNNVDHQNNTALHHAVKAKDNDALFTLTKAGANPNITNNHGNTALLEATKQGNSYACIRLLKSGASASAQDKNGMTPLMHWILNVKPTGYLKNLGYTVGRRVFQGDWGIPGFLQSSTLLLDASENNLNVQDKNGRTALSHLARSPIALSLWSNSGSTILTLLGADVDLPDKDGVTPLMHFAQIKPKSVHDLAFSPSLSVFWRSQDINRRDSQGKTALIHAAENGSLITTNRIIFAHCRGLNISSIPANPQQTNSPQVDPNIQDHEQNTALMKLAALDSQMFNPSALDSLTNLSIKPLLLKFNSTFRELKRHFPYDHPLSNSTTLLLLADANPKLKNKNGETALMIAAKKGNLPVLEVLSKRLETLEQKDHQGKTALQLAKENHQKAAVKLLSAAGARE